MTYIELVNRFWELNQVKTFSSIEVAVYFSLLNECNIRRWLNPFELRTRYLEYCFEISRKSIGEARNRLKQRNLIDFIEGKGKRPSLYLIKGAKVTNKELVVTFNVSTGNNKSNNIGNNTGNNSVTTEVTTRQFSPINNIKTKKKDKDNSPTSRAGECVGANADGCLFSGKDLENPKGVKASKLAGFSPPTSEEVRNYFALRGANLRLPDWETEAEAFFCYFDSQGWVKSNGRKVASWESLANDWILRKKRELKQQESNENSTANRGDTPDGRLACEQSKLAGRIMQRYRTRGDGGDTELPF